MPFTCDVRLPRDYTPRFPERCVCCGRTSPGRVRKFTAQTVGAVSAITLHGGDTFSIRVPCCQSCGRRVGARWIILMIALAPLILLGGWLALVVSHKYQIGGWAKRWTIGLFALLATCPLGLWNLLFPPQFDVTPFVESVDYEFRDPSYAREFAALNSDHIVSIN